MVVTLSVSDLQRLVRKESANCTRLGLYLGIPLATLEVLERQSQAPSPTVKFRKMCELWLMNEEDRKWSVVFKALKQRDNRRLEVQLKKRYKEDDTGDYVK